MVSNLAPDVRERIIKIEPDDLLPWRHQRVHSSSTQAKHTLNHVPLYFIKRASLSPLLDQHFDLFPCHQWLHLWSHAQHSEHHLSRETQQTNHWRSDHRHHTHWHGDHGSDPFGVVQRQLFGY